MLKTGNRAVLAGLLGFTMGIQEGAAKVDFHLVPGSIKFNGGVRVVNTDGSIKKLGTVSIFPTTNSIPGNNELGLVGMTLDPNFETNNWMYLIYQPPTPNVTKISRFKVTAEKLDLASEENLITLPNQRNYCCHTGGGMQFDNKGDLWMSIGNNTRNSSDTNGYVDESSPDKDDQAHAANTNDYRGKILRIHPIASAGADGKFYTIPAGNLKEYYGAMWTDAEKAKVLPEIYTMGHRSNFTISVDTTRGWLSWGDIGPDEGRQTEELNVTTKPGFMGWPYFAGSARTDAADPYAYKPALHKDPAAPMNTSPNNTGVQKLPPAIPATFGYTQEAAVTGPIYHWNAAQTNPKRLPPHFDGKWLISDFNVGELQVATLDAAGAFTGRTSLIDGLTRPLQVTVGPDGLLYTLEYGSTFFVTDKATAIKRWEYNGTACAGTGIGIHAAPASARANLMVNLGLDAKRSVTVPAGRTGFRLFDMAGKQVFAYQGAQAAQAGDVEIPASVANGLYRVLLD